MAKKFSKKDLESIDLSDLDTETYDNRTIDQGEEEADR